MRCCSGSSSPHPLGLSIHWSPSSSSPPAPRHLQVCLAWTLFLAAAARTRLTLARLTLARGRPASLPLPAMRTPLEACGASFRVESIAMESFDLESAGAHARSFFDAGPGHCMVNETLSLHRQSGPGRMGQLAYISRRRGLVCLGLLDVNAQALKARQDGAALHTFQGA